MEIQSIIIPEDSLEEARKTAALQSILYEEKFWIIFSKGNHSVHKFSVENKPVIRPWEEIIEEYEKGNLIKR